MLIKLFFGIIPSILIYFLIYFSLIDVIDINGELSDQKLIATTIYFIIITIIHLNSDKFLGTIR